MRLSIHVWMGFLLIFLVCSALMTRSTAADTVVPTLSQIIDQPAVFHAIGTLTTTDDPSNNGLPGQNYVVSNMPSTLYWRFNIQHRTGNPHWNAQGAVDAQICIDTPGTDTTEHHDGPHPIDIDPNPLTSVCSMPTNVVFGAAGTKVHKTVKGEKPHPTTSLSETHVDHYVLNGVLSAMPALPGTGNQLTGSWDLHAKHTEKKASPSDLEEVTWGSKKNAGFATRSGSSVSFNHNTGQLSFTIGPVDILDAQGGFSGGISPAYSSDPAAQGVMSVTPLTLQSSNNGIFVFGGGVVTLTDPNGKFGFVGTFSEYNIRGATGLLGTSVVSYALLEDIEITNIEDPTNGFSPFLEDFVDINLGGQGLTDAEWLDIQGTDLTFITDTNFIATTNSFTQSATLPATILVSANGTPSNVAPPASLPTVNMVGALVMVLLVLVGGFVVFLGSNGAQETTAVN